jgi:prevent-host-death family protein
MMPKVRPSSDVRNHYAEVSRSCREERRPTILTVNGRGDTVIMGIEDYEEQQARLELLETLVSSGRDVAEGRVAPMEGTLEALRAELSRTSA